VLETRLRFVRRLVEALIIVVGIATALSQFTALDRFATSVLASTAFIVAVVGFAAQQTLANVIAGVMLAITQPIRIGDGSLRGAPRRRGGHPA
jgi:small-conductance mechanosensitive channel